MIVLDIESTGTEPQIHGIVSIGAVDILHPERQFYDECRVWEGAHINADALKVNGFTEEELSDPYKKSEEEIVRAFIAWAINTEDHTLAAHNPSFDVSILKAAATRHHIDWPFAHRSIDSHTACYTHIVLAGLQPPLEKGRSALNLDSVLAYVGLPEEPRPHNALSGARRAAEALSRILYGKTLFEEFEEYPIMNKLMR